MWGVAAEKHPIILYPAVRLGAEAFDSCDSSQIIEFSFIAHEGVIKTKNRNFSGRRNKRHNAIAENGMCSSAGRCAAIVALL